jgi:hypothetical protein
MPSRGPQDRHVPITNRTNLRGAEGARTSATCLQSNSHRGTEAQRSNCLPNSAPLCLCVRFLLDPKYPTWFNIHSQFSGSRFAPGQEN